MKQHISATTIFPADLLHLRRVAMAMRFVWSTCPQSRLFSSRCYGSIESIGPTALLNPLIMQYYLCINYIWINFYGVPSGYVKIAIENCLLVRGFAH